MIRPVLNIKRRAIARFIKILAGLALFFASVVLAEPLELSRLDQQFALASSEYSSGFFPVSADDKLQAFPDINAYDASYGLRPDFKKHARYWLYTEVVNKTPNRDWVLHISNFGFLNPKVLVKKYADRQGFNSSTVKEVDADINSIGRATKLELESGQSYLLVVELQANNVVWHPYIALMSHDYYQGWKLRMDFANKLAIGIILGLILIALICWVVMSEKVFFWGGLSSLLMLVYYLEHSSLPAIFWQSNYEKTFLFWLLISATLISHILFAATFLQLNKHDGAWHKAYIGVLAITVCVLLASTFLPFHLVGLLYACNYILVWGFILSSGVARLRAQGSFYVLYILGWLPLVLSILHVIVVLYFTQKSDHIQVSYKLIHVLYVQILHMVIHATALIYRVKSLRDDKAHAENLSQAKSRFIAQSSHDLRQPLTSMNLFLEYLKPHIQSKDGLKIFERLQKTQQHMQESFNNILDLSRLEAGVLNVHIRPVSIEKLFIKLQQEFQFLAIAKSINLHIHSSTTWVLSDPVLLERILRNLLANAIHYTKEGKVVLGCRRKEKQLVIQVLDTGCGIDPNNQSEIFNIYKRSIEQQSHASGIGIGLSIVKQICELLGHPLHMSSKVNEGSQFSITAPLVEESTVDTNNDINRNQASAFRVVLIFENPEYRKTITDYFVQWGCLVETAQSIDSALERAIREQEKERSNENGNKSKNKIQLLLCDYPCVSRAMTIERRTPDLREYFIAACVCETALPLPENWINLSEKILPAQLRTLLNHANRHKNTVIS